MTRKLPLAVALEPTIVNQLDVIAQRKRRNRSEIIRFAVEEYIARDSVNQAQTTADIEDNDRRNGLDWE